MLHFQLLRSFFGSGIEYPLEENGGRRRQRIRIAVNELELVMPVEIVERRAEVVGEDRRERRCEVRGWKTRAVNAPRA